MDPLSNVHNQIVQNNSQQAPAAAKQKTKEQVLFETLQPFLGHNQEVRQLIVDYAADLTPLDEGNAFLKMGDLKKAIASFAVVINEGSSPEVVYNQAVKGVRQVLEKLPHTSENEVFFFECLELVKEWRFSDPWFDKFIFPFFVQHPDAKSRLSKIEERKDKLFYHIKTWANWFGGEHFKPNLQMAKKYAEEGVKKFPNDSVESGWLGSILLDLLETIPDAAEQRVCLETAIALLEKCKDYEKNLALAKEWLSTLDTDAFDLLHQTLKDTYGAVLSQGNEADRGFIQCVAEALKKLHLSEERLHEMHPIEWIIDHVLPYFRAQSIDPKACPRIRTRLVTLEQMSATDENLKVLLLLILWKGTNVVVRDLSGAIQLAEELQNREIYAMPVAYILGDLYFQKYLTANTSANLNKAMVRLETNAEHIKDQKMDFSKKLAGFGFTLSEIHSQLSDIYCAKASEYLDSAEKCRQKMEQLKIDE